MTLDKAFKQVYEKELAPYGFQRIKGSRPYFVRMVGDEIAHVISYRTLMNDKPYKNFDIMWGVATVYRGRINLEISARELRWMRSVQSEECIFGYLPDKCFSEKAIPGVTSNFDGKHIIMEQGAAYDVRGHRNLNVVEALEYSVACVKKYTFPLMDEASTLRGCIEYASTVLDDDKEFDWGQSNEGLLCFKVFTMEEYEKYWETIISRTSNNTEKKIYMEARDRQIPIFQKYTQNEMVKQKMIEEMERRKLENQAILRGYGIEF